jgi:hypothetical protein
MPPPGEQAHPLAPSLVWSNRRAGVCADWPAAWWAAQLGAGCGLFLDFGVVAVCGLFCGLVLTPGVLADWGLIFSRGVAAERGLVLLVPRFGVSFWCQSCRSNSCCSRSTTLACFHTCNSARLAPFVDVGIGLYCICALADDGRGRSRLSPKRVACRCSRTAAIFFLLGGTRLRRDLDLAGDAECGLIGVLVLAAPPALVDIYRMRAVIAYKKALRKKIAFFRTSSATQVGPAARNWSSRSRIDFC